jgi:hypothetical protein
MLERYLVGRQLYPQWFRGLDIDEPAISELLEGGYIVPLPQRDGLGRQVILTCAGEYLDLTHLLLICQNSIPISSPPVLEKRKLFRWIGG